MANFRTELENLINKHSRENGSNTPDFILAEYLDDCLSSFDKAVSARQKWHTPESAQEQLYAAGVAQDLEDDAEQCVLLGQLRADLRSALEAKRPITPPKGN